MSERPTADYLLERLKHYGVDVYQGGPFNTLRDRLADVLIRERMASVIVGRYNGKPQSYGELFEQVFGVKLKDVPRDTKSKQAAQS